MSEKEQPDGALSLTEVDKMVTRFGKELEAATVEMQEHMRGMQERMRIRAHQMNGWVARKEVNNRTRQTRWVVTRGSHRYTSPLRGAAYVKSFRTRGGAERRALKLNVSEGWGFLD